MCRAAHRTRLLIAYGGEPWYNRALLAGGCVLAEEVIFFELPHLDPTAPELQLLPPLQSCARPQWPTSGTWRFWTPPVQRAVAYGTGRLAPAGAVWPTDAGGDGRQPGRLLALTGYREDVAQVARLAVHPARSGHGIGRQLLAGGLQAAANLGCRRAVLNTQADNRQAPSPLWNSFSHPPENDLRCTPGWLRQRSGTREHRVRSDSTPPCANLRVAQATHHVHKGAHVGVRAGCVFFFFFFFFVCVLRSAYCSDERGGPAGASDLGGGIALRGGGPASARALQGVTAATRSRDLGAPGALGAGRSQ